MRIAIFLFASGVFACSQLPALPDRAVWAAAALAAVCCASIALALRWHGKARRAQVALLWVAAFAAGFANTAVCAGARLAQSLPHALEGRDIELTGVVASLPQRYGAGVRFEFEVESAPAGVPSRLWLSWYAQQGEEDEAAASKAHAGERWRLVTRLKRPRGNVNPHGFDFEAYLFERGIRATGYVRASDKNARLDEFVVSFETLVERARERVRDRIERVLGDADYGGVIAALAVGDQRAIDNDYWTIFNRTGITHLMAISGFHITMIASLVGFLCAFLWRRIPAAALRVPAQKIAIACGLLAAFAYCFIAGMGVPSQRTLIMLSVGAIALWSNRTLAPSRVLMLALLAVLLIDPFAVIAAGFWLSFCAVAVLMFACNAQMGSVGWFKEAWKSQWVVTLGLIPVLLALFGQFSLISPLANALAIPVVSFVVTPLALLGAFLGFDGALVASEWVLRLMMVPIEWLAELPWAVWYGHAASAPVVGLAVAGCIVAMLPRGFPLRVMGAVMVLPLFLALPPRAANGQARVTALDVGQGLSVHLQTARHDLLFDTGRLMSAEANSGNRVIVPYLRASGVSRLDALVISHEDLDHAGGVDAVAESIEIVEVFDSLPEDSAIRPEGVPARRCAAGQRWEWDGVVFEMLHPAGDFSKRNDRSCVLMVSAGADKLLIAADVEAPAERALVERLGEKLRAQTLIVPHHGSRTSSTPEFLAAVSPQRAIFTVGYRNRYRHPNREVYQRYRDAGVDIYRSDRDGAVRFTLGGAAGFERARERQRRMWFDEWAGG